MGPTVPSKLDCNCINVCGDENKHDLVACPESASIQLKLWTIPGVLSTKYLENSADTDHSTCADKSDLGLYCLLRNCCWCILSSLMLCKEFQGITG